MGYDLFQEERDPLVRGAAQFLGVPLADRARLQGRLQRGSIVKMLQILVGATAADPMATGDLQPVFWP
jgi:hypothetical protein